MGLLQSSGVMSAWDKFTRKRSLISVCHEIPFLLCPASDSNSQSMEIPERLRTMDDSKRVHPTTSDPASHTSTSWNEYDDVGEWLPTDGATKLDCEWTLLFVSNREDDKVGIVDAIANTSGSEWVDKTTQGGLRILNRKDSSGGRVLLDTTPLECVNGKSTTAVAKRWVSQNSLRRTIFGKSVVVVCIIPYETLKDPCYSSDFDHKNCWVDALRLVFRDFKGGVLFLVNDCPKKVSKYSRDRIKVFVNCHDFDQRNIVFRTSNEDVKAAIEDSIVTGTSSRGGRRGSGTTWGRVSLALSKNGVHVRPFFMKEVRSSRRKYEVWGPDRILLFGRTGSGKSTLAQMLTSGKLDGESDVFAISSSIRGCTRELEKGEGRGWYVVDTPGFGEPDNRESAMTTELVCQMVKKFVALVEGTFTHYLFVVQKGRIDELEVNLWSFFKLLFGEDLSSHFSIVVSNADGAWLEANEEHLRRQFDGCTSFLCAEFPRTEVDEIEMELRMEIEAESEEVRTSSLHELEEQLDRLRRCDRPCSYGKNSRMSKVIERDRCYMDMKLDESMVNKTLVHLSEAGAEVDKFISRLAHTMTINDRVMMKPLVL